MPEHDPEQELGPQIADAFQTKADTVRGLQERGMAEEARRRVRRRRQTLIAGAAALVVAVSIGGVWSAVGDPAPLSASSGDTKAEGSAAGSKDAPNAADQKTACPEQHPILTAGGPEAVPPGTGLDLRTPVSGLQVCRYRVVPGDTMLLGSASFDENTAQQVVDAIKVLPERNPSLPVFKCAPQLARATEEIVLRFGTAAGTKEIWVAYDGCASAGFFTGSQTYGLYAAPLKLFMKGTARPAGGTYLDHLQGW